MNDRVVSDNQQVNELGIPKSAIEQVGGATWRQKRFLLRGVLPETAAEIVVRLLSPEQ